MNVMKAKRFIVKGDVQGVGYRYFAVKAAQKLGLKGWVRNLYDGNVEAYAVGDEEDLTTFHNDLLKGPMMATVTEVQVVEEELNSQHNSFEIRY